MLPYKALIYIIKVERRAYKCRLRHRHLHIWAVMVGPPASPMQLWKIKAQDNIKQIFFAKVHFSLTAKLEITTTIYYYYFGMHQFYFTCE
jgi:hypothetical protein